MHVFHKENHYTDKLINLAFVHKEQYKWFNILSQCIYLDFFNNNMHNLSIFCKI